MRDELELGTSPVNASLVDLELIERRVERTEEDRDSALEDVELENGNGRRR